MYTMIELFSGIGSQVQAVKDIQAPIQSIGYSEICKEAITVYKALHTDCDNYGDISKIIDLPYADIWTYSFPCQDVSTMGAIKGITEGTRSGLLYEVDRLLCKAVRKPKLLLMENVTNLLGTCEDQFSDWINRLSELGYNSRYSVLTATDFGVPQSRQRVFMLSTLKGIDLDSFTFPQRSFLDTSMDDILEEVPADSKLWLGGNYIKEFHENCATFVTYPKNVKFELLQRIYTVSAKNCLFKHKRFIYDTTGPARTLLHAGLTSSPRIVTNKVTEDIGLLGGALMCTSCDVRMLTSKEFWRLTGFTDKAYEIAMDVVTDNKLYELAGNSIVTNVLAALFREILKAKLLD